MAEALRPLVFERYDALLRPVTPCRAPRIGQGTMVLDGVEMPVRPNLGIYTQPISFVGLPVRRPRRCFDAGERLPLGVPIIRPALERGRVLALARALEEAGVATGADRGGRIMEAARVASRVLGGAQRGPRTRCAPATGAAARRGSASGASSRSIPNFVGRRRRRCAAAQTPHGRAPRSKCKPAAQIPVRLRASTTAKILYAPVPYLTKGSLTAHRPSEALEKGFSFELVATSRDT